MLSSTTATAVGMSVVAVGASASHANEAAQAAMASGKAAFRAKNYDDAARLFAEAYKHDASLVSALYNRALALRKAGRKAASREAYASYHQVKPSDPDGTFGLAEAERLLGNDGEAARLFERYVAQESRPGKESYVAFAKKQIAGLKERQVRRADSASGGRSADEAMQAGAEAYRGKRYDQAAAAFGEAFAKDASNLEAKYREALSLRKGKRYDDAVSAYGVLLKRNRNHLDALFGLAETRRLMGDEQAAKRGFRTYLKREKRPGKEKYRAYAEQQLKALEQGATGAEASSSTSSEGPRGDIAEQRFQAGNDAYKAKQYDEAARAFAAAQQADPRRMDALYRQALSLRKAKRLVEAKAAYEAYVASVPADLDGLFGLAETERLLGETQAATKHFAAYLEREQRPGKERFRSYAEQKLAELGSSPQEQAQAVAPVGSSKREAAVKHMQAGARSYKAGRFREAALQFRAAHDADPTLAEARLKEALSYRKASLFDDAVRIYTEMRAERPNDLDALFGLAESHRLRGDDEKARALFASYLSQEERPERASYRSYAEAKLAEPSTTPKNDATPQSQKTSTDLDELMQLAAAHYKAKRYSQAADVFAKAMLRDGADETVGLKHALALRKAGRLDEAGLAYEGLLDWEAVGLDARFGLAETRRLQGNLAEARRHFQAYVDAEARPERSSYVQWARDKLGEFPQAPAQVAEAAPASEHFADGARAYRERRFSDAAQSFARAYEKDPDLLDALYRQALSLRRARRLAEAKRIYEAFLRVQPNEADAVYGLAETERLLGHQDEARALFAKYIEVEKRPSEARYVERARAFVEGRSPQAPDMGLAHRPALGLGTAVRAWIESGEAALARGEAHSAHGQFALALSRRPKNVRARLGYAKALWVAGQSQAAQRAFESIAQEHPGTEAARQASMWMKRTPTSDGRRKASSQEKDKARALFFRAREELAAGAFDEAQASLRDGVAMDPEAYAPTLLLGDLAMREGKTGEALRHYQRASFLNPGRAASVLAQAKAYEKLGEVGAARKLYARYVKSTAPDVDADAQQQARMWLEGYDARQPWVRRE